MLQLPPGRRMFSKIKTSDVVLCPVMVTRGQGKSQRQIYVKAVVLSVYMESFMLDNGEVVRKRNGYLHKKRKPMRVIPYDPGKDCSGSFYLHSLIGGNHDSETKPISI